MQFSNQQTCENSEDLQALRHLIEDIARQYRLDLSDRAVLTGIMDGDLAAVRASGISPQQVADLSTMLRLLLRLEYSSSEDIGVSGLCRLWETLRGVLKRFRRNSSGLSATSAPAC